MFQELPRRQSSLDIHGPGEAEVMDGERRENIPRLGGGVVTLIIRQEILPADVTYRYQYLVWVLPYRGEGM